MDVDEEITMQRALLDEFRNNMTDVLKPNHSDEFLLRWLKSKHLDLKKAEANLRLCLKIRETYQADQLLETYKPPDLMMRYGFLGFLGHDKDGTPIRYINEGRGDYYGFTRCFSIFDICIYSSYVIESDLAAARLYREKTGRHVREEMLVILDLEEFVLQQLVHRHVIETGLDLMRLFQDLYTPEIIKRVIIINAPVYFSVAYNIFKPIMRASLIQKLEVHAKEYSTEALLKYIDPDVLPACLGGNKVDENGDPRCSAFIRQGGTIPESVWKREQPFLALTMPGVKELLIPARAIEDCVVEAPEPGYAMHFLMESDNSIELCILYRKKRDGPEALDANANVQNSEEEIISPHARLQSHMCPIDAKLYCHRAGEYIFRFDNGFSWVTPKRVLYKIKMLPPTTTS